MSEVNWPLEVFSSFTLGDMEAVFLKSGAKGEQLRFMLIPAGTAEMIPAHRKNVNDTVGYRDCARRGGDSHVIYDQGMAQYYLTQDPLSGFVNSTPFNSFSARNLQFLRQTSENGVIATVFADARGYEVTRTLRWREAERYVEINTAVTNKSDKPIELGLLESFSLDMLSPFHADHAPDALRIHRYHSYWSSEGRHEACSPEELELVPVWNGGGAREVVFGQRSSMVIKEFFPTLGLEDCDAKVTWAAQLATISPWQMRIFRQGDFLTLGGGLPDLQFANWRHTVLPGETYSGIPAVVTCVRGDMQDALNRLLDFPVEHAAAHPRAEKDYPVIFNEFCTTWGEPTEEKLTAVIEKLKGLGIHYFVMDAGWFRNPQNRLPGIGDWDIYEANYPSGFDGWLDKIRAAGMAPGIWFEFENISTNAEIYKKHPDWLVTWDGREYAIDSERRFLDFRKPEVIAYLDEKVIAFLRKHRIEYMKVDYNACFDMADTPHGSLSDGAQEVMRSVHAFYEHLRKELPELTLEICASGGHRLSAEWMRLGDMASFSDCHEAVAIPLIAAQTALQIPFSANQVWATIRPDADAERLYYQLASGFIGRLCVSGNADVFTPFQTDTVRRAVALYASCVDIFKQGESRGNPCLLGHDQFAPRGYQIFRRAAPCGEVIVVHAFGDAPRELAIPMGGRQLQTVFTHSWQIAAQSGTLCISDIKDFSAAVIVLR